MTTRTREDLQRIHGCAPPTHCRHWFISVGWGNVEYVSDDGETWRHANTVGAAEQHRRDLETAELYRIQRELKW